MDGFEADDIIATLARQAAAAGLRRPDLHRRPRHPAAGQRPGHGAVPAQGSLRPGSPDPAAVQEKYLVTPSRYPELAALVGETSDNLPGVPGVGPKTAAKWLAVYDGLENVIRHADEIGGKVGDSLRAHLADVIRNRELNALVGDLDLPVTIPELQRRDWDREAVHSLFDGLEFRVLRDRLIETLPAEDTGTDGRVRGHRRNPGSRRGRPLAGRARPNRRGRARRPGSLAVGRRRHHRDRSGRCGRRRRLDRRRHGCRPRTTGRSRGGWPTRRPRRRCTTPRVRCWRSGRVDGTWPAWRATPNSRPTCCVPTSGSTTWPTSLPAT